MSENLISKAAEILKLNDLGHYTYQRMVFIRFSGTGIVV